MVVGGRESDYSVCPRPLLQFLQFFQFMSDRLHQVTSGYSGYVSLRRRDGTWSSTICRDLTNVTSVSDYIDWKCFIKINVHTLPVTSHQVLLDKFVSAIGRDDNG